MNGLADTLELLARDVLNQAGLSHGVEPLDPRKSLVGDYGLNSVALIGLVMAIEHAFKVQIRDEDLNTDNFDSLASIHELLEHDYVSAAGATP